MALTNDVTPSSLEVRPLCLHGVSGLLNCVNDTLFRPALQRLLADPNYQQKTLVFFGGDIQNFLSVMDTSDPKINAHLWCLECATHRLGVNFPSHHIVVIRPSRTLLDHINCYDNFVESNVLGTPRHVYNYKGLTHLQRILMKISLRVRKTDSPELFKFLLKMGDEDEGYVDDTTNGGQYETMSSSKKWILHRWQKRLRLHKYPLTLVGFSKGCVVLNQFLYEFHYAKRLEPKMYDTRFIDRIERMYWLDCAHSGHYNVYLSSRALLKTVAELGIDLHLHLSQYQVDDSVRPWIRQQCNEFIELLRTFNAKLVVHRHVSEFIDLRAHFEVFLSFMRVESESAPPPAAAPADGPAPPPLPPPAARSPPARPPGPPPLGPRTPRERAIMHREILGIALVHFPCSQHLSLQLLLRRELEDIMASYGQMEDNQTAGNSARSTPRSTPSRSDPGPSSAPEPVPSTSREQPSEPPRDPNQPSTSGTRKRPSEDEFVVLLKKRSAKINFETDLEANEAYESAKHFKMDSPVIAMMAEGRSEPAVNIYTPVNDHYTPFILNRWLPSHADSSTATTPGVSRDGNNSMEGVPGPSRAVTANTSNSRTDTRGQSQSDSSSDDSSSSSSEPEAPRARRTRRLRRNTAPYSSRGNCRYNLRSRR